MSEGEKPLIPPPPPPPAPPNASTVPDEYTRTQPDWTSGIAESRILHLDSRFFRYGTNDKGHAAALVLSVCLLLTAVALCLLGIVGLYSGKDAPWLTTALTWIGNGFLFTAGIAVGKSGRDKADTPKSD